MSMALCFIFIIIGLLCGIYHDLGWYGVIGLPIILTIIFGLIFGMVTFGDYMGWLK